ncbi:MAG TPA: DUF4328 domain-containing protein [Actinophytocola sp.]|jgi:hypothetical protein|uniref:DUF4328 domain-containing protein n=1 Tax=Actinophytocola sp. TaxID=1872138 RepID=UPI002F94B486
MTRRGPTLPEPGAPRPAPLLGPTATASFLVAGACVVGVLEAWSAWHRHSVGTDYAAGVPGVWVADLASADATARMIGLLYVIALLAAGIALLVWLARVRANARLLADRRPLSTGWAFGAWFATTLVALALTYVLRGWPALPELRGLAIAETFSVALQCVAGGLVIVVVRRVTRRQLAPHPVARA